MNANKVFSGVFVYGVEKSFEIISSQLSRILVLTNFGNYFLLCEMNHSTFQKLIS